MRKLIIVVLLADTLSTPSLAIYTSGNELLDSCTSVETHNQFECSGYVRAIADAFEIFGYISPENAITCIPTRVTVGQLRDVAVRYLRSNPERRHFGAAFLLHRAFGEAWPCDSDQGAKKR